MLDINVEESRKSLVKLDTLLVGDIFQGEFSDQEVFMLVDPSNIEDEIHAHAGEDSNFSSLKTIAVVSLMYGEVSFWNPTEKVRVMKSARLYCKK